MLRIPRHQQAAPPREDEIQRSIVSLLTVVLRRDVIMFHPANGGSRHGVEAAKFKGLGVVPGVADLIFLADGRGYAMEVKRPKLGRQSPSQETFEARCIGTGIPYRIVTSAEEALQCARDWGLVRATLPASPSRD
jgi:hypothetical protein